MNSILKRQFEKKLNNKTPKWFQDWYTAEFVPYKVKMDIMLFIATAILIAVVVNVF